MPDYDVAAVALASPPQSAPVASYRPAVAVKNLGVHNADVTGTLRIYDRDAGTLLETKALAASAITPGESRNAPASTLWEPTELDIGRAFLFIASIDYPPDQYLPNNNLAPVTVIVSAAEPPPPPPVEAHASQHEDGGGDELTLEGLTGKLAQAQTPTEHASAHESGGADELSVDALAGVLADPQTPKTHAVSHQPGGSDPVTGVGPSAHHTSHEPGGSDQVSLPLPDHHLRHEASGEDPISVDGLSGMLADPQEPVGHHTSHEPGGGDQLSGVEFTSNKDQTNGYAGVGADGVISQSIWPSRWAIFLLRRAVQDVSVPASSTNLVLDSYGQDTPPGRSGAGGILTGYIDWSANPGDIIDVNLWIRVRHDTVVTDIPWVKFYNTADAPGTVRAFPFHVFGMIDVTPGSHDLTTVSARVTNNSTVPVDLRNMLFQVIFDSGPHTP